MKTAKPESALVPPSSVVRTALAKNVREAGRLRRLLRIAESRDRDDLAKRRSLPGREGNR